MDRRSPLPRRLWILGVLGLLLAGSPPAGAAREAGLEEGLELYGKGAYAEALPKLLEAVQAEDPGDPVVYYAIGFCYEQAHNRGAATEWKDKALPLLAAAVEDAPSLEELYYLAALQYQRGSRGASQQTGQRAVALHQEQKLALASNGVDAFRLGRLHTFAGQTAAARRLYEQAVEQFSAREDPPRSYYTVLLRELADHALTNQQPAQALPYLERLVALDPAAPNAVWDLATSANRAGRLAQAVEGYDLVIRHDPKRGTQANYNRQLLLRLQELGQTSPPPDLPERLSAPGDVETELTILYEKIQALPREEQDPHRVRFFGLLRLYSLAGGNLRMLAFSSGYVGLIFGKI